MVYNWLNYVHSALFPHSCLVCGQHVIGSQNLCPCCTTELPFNRYACIRCGLSLVQNSGFVCGECQQHPPFFDRAFVPFNYTIPFNHFIPALKFKHKLEYARLMSELFIREYEQHYTKDEGASPQCIIPVPLHPKRLRQRGFNQSLEISRSIATYLDLNIDLTAIKRIKNTDAQSELDKSKRKHNMQNAFEISNALPYTHVIVFDDVITTGYTVNEIARILKRSGVTTVEVWAITRA